MKKQDAQVVVKCFHNNFAPHLNEPDFGSRAEMDTSLQWYVRLTRHGREFIIDGSSLYTLVLTEVGLGDSGIDCHAHLRSAEIYKILDFLNSIEKKVDNRRKSRYSIYEST